MTGRPFSYDDLFPDRWLHADDLQGREVTLTITAAYQEDLRLPGGSIDSCGILSFAKTKKEYVLNKSNALVLVGLWGKQSEEWVGHRITLGAVPDESGKSASGYRIVFVGSPDIEKPVKVAQPQGKSRTIKVTKVAKGPAHVDAESGEVMDDGDGEDGRYGAQEPEYGAPTPEEPTDTTEPVFGETEPFGNDDDELDLALGNVAPIRPPKVTKKQLAEVQRLRKLTGIYDAELVGILDTYGQCSDLADLTEAAAANVIAALSERVQS